MTLPKGVPQAEVIGFLLSPRTYPVPGPVEHVETHGAHVFLCGDVALKIKRAVRYDYMDLSTPELRHDLLLRELELNRPSAPMIYRDVIALTRTPDGGLELDGAGPPVEWVLRMHRFAADCEMTEVAASGRLTDPVAEALGQEIQRFHDACPLRQDPGDDLIRDILDELERVLTPFAAVLRDDAVPVVLREARRQLAALAGDLRVRTRQGHVRRVHGDLHLRNLLLIEGKPVLFDALEFDERLATCDVLYDMAFLLMDLCHRGLGRQANAAMNAYLLAAAGKEDAGLAALPLFMAVRATIRAMVLLQTGQIASGTAGNLAANLAEARQYLDQAGGYLALPRPRLIAVGGLSGTGKTVLARDLAPGLGPCPGAVHLRTDTERKARAVAIRYDATARAGVYARLLDRAATVVAAGRSVVLDATFLDAEQRLAVAALALRLGLPFRGLWLVAPEGVLIDRVSRRRGDASDANASVVKAQIAGGSATDQPLPGWVTIDAGSTPAVTTSRARDVLLRVSE